MTKKSQCDRGRLILTFIKTRVNARLSILDICTVTDSLTKRMVLKMYVIPQTVGLFCSSVNNDIVLVTTVEDKINK